MGFGQAVATCMAKFGVFSGRASRSEFWWFYLFATLMNLAAPFVGGLAFPANPTAAVSVPMIVELFFLVPLLAAGARRLHDTGRGGWWLLLILTVVGILLLLVFWVLASEEEHGIRRRSAARATVWANRTPVRAGRPPAGR